MVQLFDSWGCNLHPTDWDIFSAPYIKRIVDGARQTHPNVPLILYASGSGGMLERMARTGVQAQPLRIPLPLRLSSIRLRSLRACLQPD